MENEKKPKNDDGEIEKGGSQKRQEQGHNASVANHHHHEPSHPEGGSHAHHDSEGAMFATVTVGVCHCGAGCVLGDIVGQWLVYGTNATIGSPARLLWTVYPVDFGFAFAFRIVFQYFSIAPMAGEYSPKVLYRALKADALSLIFFQMGLFGWMAILQIPIFDWRLQTETVTYWCMMQIGMFIGHWTSVPINWWLINTGVKMPCA